MHASQEAMKTRKGEAFNEEEEFKPKLKSLIAKTRQLQEQVSTLTNK